MKHKVTKLTEFQLSLLVCCVISAFVLLGTAIGFFFSQPGWFIGAFIGCVVEIIYVYLVNLGSTLILKDANSGLSILFYFVRMILFVGSFAVLVILQYKLHIEVFKNAYWGMLIAFAPSTFVTTFVQLKMEKGK